MSQEKRKDTRVPVGLTVKLGYGSLDEFIERHALNISRGGIFIRTRDPKPIGTPVTFAIELKGGEKVIRGKGVVTWTTPPSAPGEPAKAPGMGVKFTELDQESRGLVHLVVATRGEEGESDEPPIPSWAPTTGPRSGPYPTIPAAKSNRRSASEIRGGPPKSLSPSEEETLPGGGDLPFDTLPGSGGPPEELPLKGMRAGAPRSKRIIGIDLGTTNSCAAVSENGKARVLQSKQGYRTLPSIVAYDAHGRLLVGHPAKGQMVVNPQDTVYGSKRLVGRPFASPTVQACRDRFHYEIVEGEGGAASVRFAGRDFTLQQVSALILGEVREMAIQVLNEPVNRAVVTVPAYYNDHQRQAVREAGRLAGLEIERIVNEPTAAALAFGYGKGIEKRVLVYDLGGGTFDASILEIQGEVYEVVSTGGDTFLGGVDFDNQIVDHLVFRFAEKHGFHPPEERVVWQRIRDAAEEAKVALSERETHTARVPYLCKDDSGAEVDLEVEMTRAELTGLTERLVDRTIEVCREVLAAKSLEPKDIDEVLLVGGQSRMPLVWEKIRTVFGREPNKGVHPDEAVALGAALLGDADARIDSVVLIDVLAMGIGIGLPGGRMAPVLPRNSKLPAKKSYQIATSRDGQTEVEVQVFQGDSQKVAECEYLGTVRLAGLAAGPRGSQKVSFEFALGSEGLLSVSARNLASGELTEVKLATIDTPAALREKLGLTEPAVAPKGARPIDRAPLPPPPQKKGFFGRLFGRR
jgi:molecular chaperone DnaK